MPAPGGGKDRAGHGAASAGTDDRIAALDLLRGVAAATVAVSHYVLYFRTPDSALGEVVPALAVEVFFVLSGFVLAPQILLVLRRFAPRVLLVFLVRRWMRTVPPYLVALLAISVLFGAAGSRDFWLYAFYVQNLVGQHVTVDYFSVGWSLSVEEWCYVVFPVALVLASWGRTRSDAFYAVATLAFVAAVSVMRLAFAADAEGGADVRRVVLFRLDAIAYGFLLYLLWSRLSPPASGRLLLLGALGAATAVAVVLGSVPPSFVAATVYPFVAAAFGAAVVLGFAATEPWFRVPSMRAACDFAGRTSYPIYLFHLLGIYGVSAVGDAWPAWASFAAFGVVTLVVATASAYLLEKPLLAMRPRYPVAGGPGVVVGPPVADRRPETV